MELLIISPQKEILNTTNVDLIECDGIDGKFQILKDHTKMVSVLKSGKIRYTINNEEKNVYLNKENAILKVENNKIIILL